MKFNHYSLRELRTFVTVAECGTVAAAANRLSRSQASVSSTISGFESAIGVELFVRKPAKGLTLTPAGAMVALEARGLLAHADEFETIASALGHALEGEIAVGCFVNLAPVVFANLVARFTERYPGIRVRMELGDQQDILDGLESGRLETALTFDLGIGDAFQVVPLSEVPAHAVLPVAHRHAKARSVSLAQLAPEPLILMDLPHTRDYFLSLFYAAGVAPQVRYRSTSFEAVRTLVGNGLGYAILNLKPAADTTYDGTRVACVPLSDLHRPLHIVLVTLKKIAKRRMVATFQDFARGYLKDWQARSVVARPGRRRP